jgi:CBS domain-containing protein
MRVEDIMTRKVCSCTAGDSLERAAQLMWEHDCGSLPVCARSDGADRTVGIVTDRDICMHALFSGKSLRELRVEEAMAKQVLTCRPDDTFDHAEKVMRGGRVRRLPVVGEHGALVGLISLADLAREAARESPKKIRDISEMDVGDTLAAICVRPVQSLRA